MKKQIVVVEPKALILTDKAEIETFYSRIELAGRTAYKSHHKTTADSAGKFVAKIVKLGHDSVLEHCSITARITGSRTMSHQLVRHRIGSYVQESQRYCNYGKSLALQVVVPDILNCGYLKDGDVLELLEGGISLNDSAFLGDETLLRFVSGLLDAYDSYIYLLSSENVRIEDAREILPNAVKTEVVVTFNLRQWRSFFIARCDRHAQRQIRKIALSLLIEFNKLLPLIFGDILDRLKEEKNLCS